MICCTNITAEQTSPIASSLRSARNAWKGRIRTYRMTLPCTIFCFKDNKRERLTRNDLSAFVNADVDLYGQAAQEAAKHAITSALAPGELPRQLTSGASSAALPDKPPGTASGTAKETGAAVPKAARS